MSENHTKGPHTVEQIGRRPIMKAVSATVISFDGERLADFRHAADANLFAAAPEMREALQAVRANLVRLAWEENSVMIEGIDKVLSKAEAAS